MPSDNRLLDDLARIAAGAASAASGMRDQIEAGIRDQIAQVLARFDVVTREEFDAVKEMASRARVEQEGLALRLTALEARLGAGPAPLGGGGIEPEAPAALSPGA